MKVFECLDRIRFNTATLDDLSGKAITTLFSNKNIIAQLKYALDKYASETLAIEGIYSIPLATTVQSISAPQDALRTQTYKFIILYINGYKYYLRIESLINSNTYFRYQWQGIPSWVIPWQNELQIFPISALSYWSTALAADISSTDTTITVENAGPLISKNGRVTIGDEKIVYGNRVNNTLNNCIRGVEGTTPTTHNEGESVLENNLQIYYFKKHFNIPIYDNNYIDPVYLNMEMEVCDEHMEMITDYTSYKLLSKVDMERAQFFKINFDEWLNNVKADVRFGRQYENSGNVRDPYFWEESIPATFDY